MIEIKLTIWEGWHGGTRQPGFRLVYTDGGGTYTTKEPIYLGMEPDLFDMARAAKDVLRVVAFMAKEKEAADG